MLFEADYAKNYASIMYQCLFVAQWLERATRIRKTLGSIPGGAALCFFYLIRMSVLLSLSELKERRI